MNDTQSRILDLVRDHPRTPLTIVRKLEGEGLRDVRRTLLRLICNGTVRFVTEGTIEIP